MGLSDVRLSVLRLMVFCCSGLDGEHALQEFSVMGYTLLLSLIEYKTMVLRGDFDAANEILPQIPQVCTFTAQALCQVSLQTRCSHGMHLSE